MKQDKANNASLELVRSLCPAISEHELEEEACYFDEYIAVLLRIYERLEREEREKQNVPALLETYQ